jgi:group I intron endonuclease
MPQLLPFYFVNMLSYSFLLFVVILYVFSTYILPKYKLLFSIRMSLLGNNTPLAEFIMLIYSLLLIEQSNVEFLQTYEILLSFFVPIMIYSNPDRDKSRILSDLKGKAGIYMWTHKETGKFYIGSAIDLSKRLGYYYTPSGLKRADNYISRALILHTHSAFSLSILKYIEIENLDKEKTRLLILESEQYYLDIIFSLDEPKTYNILKVAGSSLGTKHSEETKALMSESRKGKTHTAETKAKIGLAKSGENHPFYGKIGDSHPMYGRTGENHPMYGRTGENNILSKKVYVYSNETPTILSHEFVSCTEAAKHFKCSIKTISLYLKNGKIFQKEWILSSSKK